jgi:hypothetical protein
MRPTALHGGREIPKVELEMMVKLFDPEMSNRVDHESFAHGLMLLKDDSTLNRLLGQDLSRWGGPRGVYTLSTWRLHDVYTMSTWRLHAVYVSSKWCIRVVYVTYT